MRKQKKQRNRVEIRMKREAKKRKKRKKEKEKEKERRKENKKKKQIKIGKWKNNLPSVSMESGQESSWCQVDRREIAQGVFDAFQSHVVLLFLRQFLHPLNPSKA